MSQLNALDIRKGYLVQHQGRMCTIIDWSIMRNDRRQYIFITLKDLLTGRVTELKEHGDTKFDVLETDNVELAHSYTDGPDEVFYDKEGVEYRVNAEAAKDALMWKSDQYKGFLVDGTLVTISPPSTVVAVVTDTSPPVKGANASWKDAVLDNGVKLKVGNLVNVGDKVKVDPVTLEFRERA
jgi:translation elongation factor P/translation initiation factor 5A